MFLSITLGLIALHAVGPHEAAEGALLRGVYQANHEQLQWRFSANQGKLCFQKTLTPCAGSVLGDLSWAFDPAQNNYRLKTLCLSRTSSGTHAENSDDVLTHQQLASHMKCHLENLFRFVGVSHDPLPLPLSDEAPLLALWSQYDIKLHHLAEQRGLQNRTQDFNFF
ncbi:MAG: hypothetical protein ACPG7U_00770 [Holosporaceae bacterium]